ncbi:MAG: hypothetical protein D6814_04085, partial [Calditrichaeota bacterium]
KCGKTVMVNARVTWVGVLLLLIFSLFHHQALAAGEVKLSAKLQEQKVPLNREAHLIVEAQWQGKPNQFTLSPVEPPNVTNLKITGTAVSNRVETANEQIVTIRRYEFTFKPLALGMAYIDGISLQYKDQNDESYSLEAPRLQLEVIDAVPEPGKRPLLPILGISLAILIIAAGAIFAWKRKERRRREAEAAQAEEKSLEEIFTERLHQEVSLDADDLPQQYAGISNLLRKYLIAAFSLGQGVGTTEELIGILEQKQVPTEQLTRIQEVLQTCDVVKFSGAPADPNQLARIYTLTEDLFRQKLAAEPPEVEGKVES